MVTPGLKPNRLETMALFKAISARCFLPEDTVRIVIESLGAVVKESMLREESVVIRNFGTFKIKRRTNGVAIRFKVSEDFRKDIKEVVKPMEKHAVDETNNNAVLIAKMTGKCPVCKAELSSKNPPICPTHGSEPFEEKKP